MGETSFSPGIYRGVSNEDYHACKDAVSNSGLGDILQSPFHYYAKHIDPNRPAQKEKAGQLEGTLAHCAILEPDEFDKRYVVGPDLNRNSTKWKEYAAECEQAGILPIKQDQYDTAMRQSEQVWKNPDAAELLSHGEAEVSAFWVDDETGVLCRCRPDWVADYPSGKVLVDVKTYSDASPDEFARQVARKGYARQDAMYSDGYSAAANTEVLSFLFIAVEAAYPFAVSICELDEDSVNAGYMEYRDALRLYAECKKSDNWPGYSQAVNLIRMPNWAINKAELGMEVKL